MAENIEWSGRPGLRCCSPLAPFVQARPPRAIPIVPIRLISPNPGRRRQRHHRAHHRGEDVHHPRRLDRGRQPRRRRRQDRRRSGRPRRAGRLHAAGGLGLHPFVRAGGHRQARLRSDQGLRADLAVRAGAERAGGEPRSCRPTTSPELVALAKAQPGQAQLRLRRARLDQPFRGRHVRRARRHPERHRPRAVTRAAARR